MNLLKEKQGTSDIDDRRQFATEAFKVSSGYDSAIFRYFDNEDRSALRISLNETKQLRYGENPHQKGTFYGDFDEILNSCMVKRSHIITFDIDAAVTLISDFDETALAILKHNNACGMACRPTVKESWDAAGC